MLIHAFDVAFYVAAVVAIPAATLYLCYLVGKMARAKGHPFVIGFWVSFFLTPLIGYLIVYLLAEAKTRGPLKCPVCGVPVVVNQPFCSACGIQFEPDR
jgi:hypothetical protein